MQYFIEGIPDSKLGKSILYQAKRISDLKEKMHIYEQIRGPTYQATTSKFTPKFKEENVSREVKMQKRCFKCGEIGHLANDCKDNSIICFKCGESGHKANSCKKRKHTKKLKM